MFKTMAGNNIQNILKINKNREIKKQKISILMLQYM